MHAHIGDWIVVPSGGRARRGRVVAIPSADGTPPYRVRWVDEAAESLVVPPPGAFVSCPAATVTAELSREE
jgi:hypothetical protein